MSKALATKNVAAVLLGVAMVFGFAFSFAMPAKADTLSDLQAQVQALLAQIAALQAAGGSSTASTGGACFTFTQNLKQGMSSSEVMQLQKFLNNGGFTIAATGAGSPGNETSYFGSLTKAAVIKWQNANAAGVLTPVGLKAGTGYWGPSSRAYANSSCTSTGTGSTGSTGGTTTPTGPGLTIAASTQPSNSLAPASASRVPFTVFTLTNNTSAAVTVNGITVQRGGLAQDAAFAGIILVDSTGMQYGNSQSFNSNHQATIGGMFTLNPGETKTFTVAGNMAADESSYAGQVASISVVGVNTSVPVAGSLPISGAYQTINNTLTIGTASVTRSSFDPNSSRSESLGTTGLIFGGIRVTASGEDQKLYSITWNQTGSVGSTDLSNLKTYVNGTAYPITVDASGKYYTTTIPGGVLITKGNSADIYIQGDLTGSNSANRTAEFDIYRSSDIYLVGQTYGYGVTPTASSAGTYAVANNSTSGFQASSNPFYFGATMTVTAGTLSTVSSASSVAPQNIAVNVPDQVLGGFTTNFTGEPVTVQSVTVDVASSTNGTQLQNVTLVDQNGAVVAGPVDETLSSKKIVFNSSVTFPTGPMTYTIKGTVAYSASVNGSTYTLSTNPNTEWSSAQGQTSGTYVTLPSTTITMSTMTVQAGALNISASADPAATTVAKNQSTYTIANIVLDASGSGEDVRLSALPVMVSATGTVNTTAANAFSLQSNLTNCQLYNGTTVLNNQSIGNSQWAAKTDVNGLSVDGIEANFIFNSPLTVPKGSSVTLALKCSIGGNFYNGEQFAAGVDDTYPPTVTGAVSGNTVTPNVTNGTSGTMTVGTPTLTATTPTFTYSQAVGGADNVSLGSFTLTPASGDVNIQNVGLKLNSNYASSSDLVSGVVSIWNGSTQVGQANFNGVSASADGFYYATSSSMSLNIAQNAQTTLTLKGHISTIGAGSAGTSGHEILVGLADANGTASNSQVDSGTATQPGQGYGVAIFRTFPKVAQITLGSTGVTGDNQLIEFSVTADNNRDLGVDQFVFTFASSTKVTITNPQLYYSDGGTPTTLVANGVNGATSYSVANNAATTTLATPLEIPAGHTWNFLLKAASITYSGTASTYNISTTLLGDGTDLAASMVSGATATTTYNFVWSPNSATTYSTGSSTDWTNGYGVQGLPSFGITQTRSN